MTCDRVAPSGPSHTLHRGECSAAMFWLLVIVIVVAVALSSGAIVGVW
jgi:hypothetical protein